MNPSTENSKSPKFPWVRLFRIFVVASVIGAVIYTGLSASKQLSENDFDFRNTEFGWWIAAIGCYIVTLVLSSVFWHRVLVAMGQSPKFGKSLLAFFASQLGKYIPGKAMVVVIRTDMIRGDKVGTAPAAASVFVETLTWIFVGSAIASLLLIFRFQDQVGLQITAALLTIVAGVLTWPPIFRAIALKLGAAKGRSVAKAFSGLDFSTMSLGWIVMALGWCFNGFSLWLVLKGLPDTNVTIADFPLTLACVSLATVAGFASLLPGGIGVRELVMIPLLGSRFGSVTAIVAAVVIRVVWLAAELVTSGIIYIVRRTKT